MYVLIGHLQDGPNESPFTRLIKLQKLEIARRYSVLTFLAVLNFCCIACSNVGFVWFGALHLSNQLLTDILGTSMELLHFKLHMLRIVETVCEQDWSQVEIRITATVEAP